MIQFNQWNKTTIQVGLEGAVFIFVHRLPFAIRAKEDKTTFINAAMCQMGSDALECYEKLQMMNWKTEKLLPDQFREKAKEAYAGAILDGARRIGMECINLKEKENDNLDKGRSGHVTNRNARNRRARSKTVG
jgi:hypothetical protein